MQSWPARHRDSLSSEACGPEGARRGGREAGAGVAIGSACQGRPSRATSGVSRCSPAARLPSPWPVAASGRQRKTRGSPSPASSTLRAGGRGTTSERGGPGRRPAGAPEPGRPSRALPHPGWGLTQLCEAGVHADPRQRVHRLLLRHSVGYAALQELVDLRGADRVSARVTRRGLGRARGGESRAARPPSPA